MGVIFSELPLSNIWTSFVLIMRQQLLFAITTSPIIHLVCPSLTYKKYKPFVFSFSWSHEELKTMLMQSFWGQTRCIIIRSKFFFLFIGRERTTWPPNNCLMVCSCTMPSNCVWLQIIFCTCVKEAVLFSYSPTRSCVKMTDRFASRGYSLKSKLGDRMIKQLLNSVIICLSLRPRQIIDLLATDKSP